MQSLKFASSESGFETSVDLPPHMSHTSVGHRSGWHSQIRPVLVPGRRKSPLLVRTNRVLRTLLIAMCGVCILGYGLDVAASSDVSKLQDQARRLSEQNTELSAQLLRVISFQGIQDSVLGRFGLRVPEQVLIVKEVPPYPLLPFKPLKHHLPILTGY